MEFSLLADIASIVLELEPGLLELPCTNGPLATCPSVGALPSLSLVSAARRLEKYRMVLHNLRGVRMSYVKISPF